MIITPMVLPIVNSGGSAMPLWAVILTFSILGVSIVLFIIWIIFMTRKF